MKYILIIKDVESQKEIEQKIYRSLLQISKELKTTYCACYENFLCSEDSTRPKGRKRSQIKFNQRYQIKALD
jgi:hypothetical protein